MFLFLDHFGVSEIRKESMTTEFPDDNKTANGKRIDDQEAAEINEIKSN